MHIQIHVQHGHCKLSHAVSATCDAILRIKTTKDLHATLSSQRVFAIAEPLSMQLVCENKA